MTKFIISYIAGQYLSGNIVGRINKSMYGFREFINAPGTDGEIINLYLNNPGLRISEIAHQSGKSEGEIYRILHANDVSPNRLRANHQKVYSLAHLGWNVRDIAELTGYTPRNVRYILAKSISEGKKNGNSIN